MEEALKGKRIMLIALSGYSGGIVKQMQNMGAIVDYFNDKPNDGFICKTLGRLQLKFYQRVLARYYFSFIDRNINNKYDYILVIRGEYTPCGALRKLKESFPAAKMILYMWDGMHKQNTNGIEVKWDFFDEVYTFDRIDYEANKDRIKFLPLYYYGELLPDKVKDCNSNDCKYDVSFIGTGHADRVRIVKDVIQQCNANNLKTYTYFFMPHPIIFWQNKLLNRDFKGVSIKEINFKMLPFDSLYGVYADSRCVVDVEHPGQHGLTMRSIEIIGLKRKFITTNADIVNYDFYNPNNILVIDRKNPIVDPGFFSVPYEPLSDEIYEKYSLKNWILSVLGVTNGKSVLTI